METAASKKVELFPYIVLVPVLYDQLLYGLRRLFLNIYEIDVYIPKLTQSYVTF